MYDVEKTELMLSYFKELNNLEAPDVQVVDRINNVCDAIEDQLGIKVNKTEQQGQTIVINAGGVFTEEQIERIQEALTKSFDAGV